MQSSNKYKEAIDLIRSSKDILVTSHVRPDGDSCGSVRGICCVAENLGVKIHPLFLSPVSYWHKFMFENTPAVLGETVQLVELGNASGDWGKIDLVIICDTNSYVQLPNFSEWLKKYKARGGKVLVFDHHITNDAIGDVEIIDTTAAACGEIVFELIKSASIQIDSGVAQALYVSLASDTGWFRFGSAPSVAYRRAAELIDLGAEPVKVYQRLYQNFELPKLKLMAKVLDGLELHLDERVAVKTIRQEDFASTGSSVRDTDGIIEQGQKIGSVKAAVLFVEQEDGRVKTSLRSKGEINVREIAQLYGGGGHDFAAGVMFDMAIEEAKTLVLAEMLKQFNT